MISGVILAKNEAGNIGDCIGRLRPYVSEVLLIDMESRDETAAIARDAGCRVIPHPSIDAFDAARNVAIGEASFDWMWFVDADERIPARTGQLVTRLIRERGSEFEAILIPFKNYFCGRWIQHSGWWPGYTMPRVLKRGHFQFRERLHQGVRVDGRQLTLPADPESAIDHFSYDNLDHYVSKFNRYTSVEARHLVEDGQTFDWRDGIREMIVDLWSYYERNQGVHDGTHGWILAWLAGQYRWFARAKVADVAGFNGSQPQCLDEVLALMERELTALRATRSAPPWSLVIRTPIWDPSGYADEGRVIVRSLAEEATPVCVEEIAWSNAKASLPKSQAALLQAVTRVKRPPNALTITNCIASLVSPDPLAGFNVLRTTFETDRIPADWLPRLDGFDEIWVFSEFNRQAFCQGGAPPEKLRVVPTGVDTEVFKPTGKKLSRPDSLRDRFLLLAVFDWQMRKGWDVLLQAYTQEFARSEPVGLLLKITTSHGHQIEGINQQIDTLLKAQRCSLVDRPDIVIWDQSLSVDEMAALYRTADAFVLPSRGEGWGRPYMEAMACGKPTIGVEGIGSCAFMNRKNSHLIASKQVAVSDEAAREISVYAGHRWREPDERSLRSAMRKIYGDKGYRQRLGKRAVRDMRTHFSLPQTARGILAAVEAAAESRRPRADEPPSSSALRVVLEGELFASHSFSNINEHLSQRLDQDPGIHLSLRRTMGQPTNDRSSPKWHDVQHILARPLPEVPQVTIRHAFPPNFDPLPSGRWVHIQPWEFGALPLDWVDGLGRADEIWAPSQYVKDIYLRSGFESDRVFVVPWGVDEQVYRPDVAPLLVAEGETFCFLFMGGAIARKGFDVALAAYLQEFGDDDDVLLIVKDQGAGSFYPDSSARQAAIEHAKAGAAPRILYIDREMTEGQRASLYAACDCLVAPYRGEGFGVAYSGSNGLWCAADHSARRTDRRFHSRRHGILRFG